MKRAGNLYNRIKNEENIKIGYYKAQKGKRLKNDVVLYRINLESNLRKLRDELEKENVSVGNYHFFKIFEPKERTICAASFRERVLHHAIMNVLDPVFDGFQIDDSYACRINKGTHKAVKRAFYFTKKYPYFMKLDIRKYFDSINHDVLKHLLRYKIKDKSVLSLLDSIIDSYETITGRGIPIGNLTSQYFANFYLGFVDRFIKEELRIKGYVRYMDDMAIWGNDRDFLHRWRDEILRYIQNALQVEVKPVYQNKCKQGLPFLGFLIKPRGIYLMQNSKNRFIKRYKEYLKNYNEELYDENDLAEHLQAIVAWTLIAKAKRFRNNVFTRYSPRAQTA